MECRTTLTPPGSDCSLIFILYTIYGRTAGRISGNPSEEPQFSRKTADMATLSILQLLTPPSGSIRPITAGYTEALVLPLKPNSLQFVLPAAACVFGSTQQDTSELSSSLAVLCLSLYVVLWHAWLCVRLTKTVSTGCVAENPFEPSALL